MVLSGCSLTQIQESGAATGIRVASAIVELYYKNFEIIYISFANE